MKVSVIIPCFNEEESIGNLVTQVRESLHMIDYEVILVDDGSSDRTADFICAHAAEDPRIHPVYLSRNYGQTAAMTAGFDAASGDVLIPMDADLQNDPRDIPLLLEKLNEGFDVVSGWRKNRSDHWTRVLPSRIANALISWFSGIRLHDFGCTLKAYRRDVLSSVRLYGEMHRFIPIYAFWNGARIAEVPVRHHPRIHGESKYGFGRIPKVLLDLLVIKLLGSYSTKPIYLFGLLGGFFMFLGTLCIGFTAYMRFFESVFVKDQPLFLVGIFLWLVAAQLVMLGLVAELVIRVYHDARGRRPYREKSEPFTPEYRASFEQETVR